jgi:hypothetical protein
MLVHKEFEYGNKLWEVVRINVKPTSDKRMVKMLSQICSRYHY